MPNTKEEKIETNGNDHRLHNVVSKATKIQEEDLPEYISGIIGRNYLILSYSKGGEEVQKVTSCFGHSGTCAITFKGVYKVLKEGITSFHQQCYRTNTVKRPSEEKEEERSRHSYSTSSPVGRNGPHHQSLCTDGGEKE